ncbi:uncharacterized protein V1510DRAFT_247361 [Dipodascopsis tothii]|uniref:uncharacterized protein n=1 Tax=Dipodascopsis tothii TaxID=44089 RepID=UPI0034CEF3E4
MGATITRARSAAMTGVGRGTGGGVGSGTVFGTSAATGAEPSPTFKLALALAIVRSKPADVSFQDYVRTARTQLADPAAFWRAKSHEQAAEAERLRTRVAELEETVGQLRERVTELEQTDRAVADADHAMAEAPARPSTAAAAAAAVMVAPGAPWSHYDGSRERDSLSRAAAYSPGEFYERYLALVGTDKNLRHATYYLTTTERFQSVNYERHMTVIVDRLRLSTGEVLPPCYFEKIIPMVFLRLYDDANNGGGKFDGRGAADALLEDLIESLYAITRRGDTDKIARAYCNLMLEVCSVPELRRNAITSLLVRSATLAGKFATTPPSSAMTRRRLATTLDRYLYVLERLCPSERGADFAGPRHELERTLFDYALERDLEAVVSRYCLVAWCDDDVVTC